MSELADFTTHKIEGFARMGNTPFSVPLFSHITGSLWVGGCPVETLPEQFKYVVCLYPWGSYRINDDNVFAQAKLYDSEDEPDSKQILALAKTVNAFIDAGTTLVHCQAGLNRSNLVAARALMLQGFSAQDAIKLLRQQRCDAVLCNTAFELWLERQ